MKNKYKRWKIWTAIPKCVDNTLYLGDGKRCNINIFLTRKETRNFVKQQNWPSFITKGEVKILL